jgi:hypothetical protein
LIGWSIGTQTTTKHSVLEWSPDEVGSALQAAAAKRKVEAREVTIIITLLHNRVSYRAMQEKL